MRTTIRIDDDLLRLLKERAATTGRSMGALIEDAVRASLVRVDDSDTEVEPLTVFGGSGALPGVDLTSSAALAELMDENEPLDALR